MYNEAKIIGQNIRLLRKEKNITQAQLGKIVSLTQDTISLWEIGKATPNSIELIKLAKFFDVTADFILGIKNY